MKKIDLGKPTTNLSEKVNRKDLYVDSTKGDKLKNNIFKQMDIINKTLVELDSTLNKMSYKKAFSDEYVNLSVQCAKKCLSQSKLGVNLRSSFEEKYTEDARNYVIKNLDERISYIENIILKNNN